LQRTTREALETPFTASLFQWSLLARYVTYHAHTLDSMPVILGMASTSTKTSTKTSQTTPSPTAEETP
jgi:hypothetical protein